MGGEQNSDLFWLVQLLRPEVLVLAGGFLVAIVGVIAVFWRDVAKHRADADLKRDMVARGLSAEEIERILKAGPERH